MNPEPRCEVVLDRNKRKFAIRYFNCPVADEVSEARARDRRIEEITRQLACPHGLTNKERTQLNRERTFLQKGFSKRMAIDEPRQQKKLKAAEKKLQWLVRKAGKERDV